MSPDKTLLTRHAHVSQPEAAAHGYAGITLFTHSVKLLFSGRVANSPTP